jgi:tRNA pseudouridine55 synthase
MDGLLVIDKPVGPTSHGVVLRARRILGEPRIGHTGTLDPAASGVLPLVIGRATRLARFLSSAEKSYEATIVLGVETDSYDSAGTEIASRRPGPLPDRETVDRALDAFRGEFSQQPPAYSAKKIGGERSHRLARRVDPERGPSASVRPAPVNVTVRRLDILRLDRDRLTVRVDCSAGFYVRSLAQDLGTRLGTGAHLAALRRLRSGDLVLASAVPLEVLENDPRAARAAIVPLAGMLLTLGALQLTEEGAFRASHGRDLGLEHVAGPVPAGLFLEGHDSAGESTPPVRLMAPGGDLLGLAEPHCTQPVLHPFVVLM